MGSDKQSALAKSTGRTLQNETRNTVDGEALAELQAEIEQHRSEAADLVARAPDWMKRHAQNILDDWKAMTPERLLSERQQAADDALRRQSAERQRQWDEFVASRGKRYERCDLDNFEIDHPHQKEVLAALREYTNNLADRISSGDGIVLFGPAGTGKDHLLVGVARIAVLGFGKRIAWQNGMDLFGDNRDRIGEGEAERSFLSRLVSPDVLYLSDPLPPFGTLSDFQASMLFRVIDRRYSMAKPTWTTINVASRKEAAERMGPQIVDRVTDGAVCLHCDWPSYRKPDSTAQRKRT